MYSSGFGRIRATSAALADPAHGTADDPALRYGGHTELEYGSRHLRRHCHATVRSGGRLRSYALDQHAPNLCSSSARSKREASSSYRRLLATMRLARTRRDDACTAPTERTE